jgi:predicted transcriptional regulator
MERIPQDATDAELAVLQVLWDQGTRTVRQIADVIYPNGTAAHYGTVQKLLERLEGKGLAGRDRTCWPHVFAAAVDRQTLIGFRLRAMAEKLCGGSLTAVLTHLVQTDSLSAEERKALRARLDELEQQFKSKTRRR